MDILFLFSPLIFTISRTFSQAGRSSGWAWPGCSITSLSGPCWMSAPAPSALTWRDKYIRYHRIPSLSNRHGVTRLYIPRSFESKDLIPMVVAISVGISINPGQCDIASHQPAQPSNIGSLSLISGGQGPRSHPADHHSPPDLGQVPHPPPPVWRTGRMELLQLLQRGVHYIRRREMSDRKKFVRGNNIIFQ